MEAIIKNNLLTKPHPCEMRKVTHPSVCFNKAGIWVYTYCSYGYIYYVMKLNNAEGAKVGQEILYGEGSNVQVAINSDGVVILVRSKRYFRKCVYSVGKVNENNLTIEWIHKDKYLCSGVNPSVAMNGSTAIFLYLAAYGFGCYTYYNVGELDENGHLEFKLQQDERLPELDRYYYEPSVAISNEGLVVVSCHQILSSNIHYGVGQLSQYSLSSFKLVGRYAHGCNSRISMWDNVLYIVRKSRRFCGTLKLKVGYLKRQFVDGIPTFRCTWDGDCAGFQLQLTRAPLHRHGSETIYSNFCTQANVSCTIKMPHAAYSQAKPSRSDVVLNIEKHLQSIKVAIWEVRPKWKSLGRALGIPEGTIRSIHLVDDGEALHEVLYKWMKEGLHCHMPNLIKALEDVTVGHKDIANKLKKMNFM